MHCSLSLWGQNEVGSQQYSAKLVLKKPFYWWPFLWNFCDNTWGFCIKFLTTKWSAEKTFRKIMMLEGYLMVKSLTVVLISESKGLKWNEFGDLRLVLGGQRSVSEVTATCIIRYNFYICSIEVNWTIIIIEFLDFWFFYSTYSCEMWAKYSSFNTFIGKYCCRVRVFFKCLSINTHPVFQNKYAKERCTATQIL